jgi:hypothetical protein
MKSTDEVRDILEACDLKQSFEAAGRFAGCDAPSPAPWRGATTACPKRTYAGALMFGRKRTESASETTDTSSRSSSSSARRNGRC